MLMNSHRADYIFSKIKFYGHDGDKTKCLGFCATVKHAQFMADEFNKKLGEGSAIALSGSNSVEERQKYLKQLEDDDSKLQYIFSRDIFNEGIDVQDVNLVLMLRPTQSSIVFTQQLGRGLRKLKGKEFLTVLDFIGNYQKSFLMTGVFSKDPNPDKKTRMREVSNNFDDIPGDTFVRFDEIVKKQILDQIDREKFMSDSNQKRAYFVFRKDNGNKVPYLTDYIKLSSEIDPCTFNKIKKGSKLLYHSYFEFVTSAENDLNTSESTLLNQIYQNKTFLDFLNFIDSLLLPAKRIEEWCILRAITDSPSASVTMEEIKNNLSKYVDYYHEENLKNACNLLAGKYLDSTQQKTYQNVIFQFDGTSISLNPNVKALFEKKTPYSSEMKTWILDYIEYAILRYDDEFGRKDYGFPFLKPYAKYSMKNIASLCNFGKIHSSFRGSGLITFAKPYYFIFVDLYKADNIREEINYHDKFLGPSTFQWQSPNDMTQESERGKDIIKCDDRNCHLYLFIRKYKEVEGIPQNYIYLGEIAKHPDDVEGEKPVTMTFAIPEVPADLYNDFITDVDKTKIEE